MACLLCLTLAPALLAVLLLFACCCWWLRSRLRTPLPDGIEDVGPLLPLVPIYNAMFYSAAAVWFLGATRQVFRPVKAIVAFLRRGNAAPKFEGVDTTYEVVEETPHYKLTMKIDLPSNVASPAKSKTASVLFIHGGGYSLSSPTLYHFLTARLAKELRVPVFSIDYRKSPEWPYPAALNDCVAAVKFLLTNAERFNLDVEKVAVGGDSGGGHLSISLLLRLLKDKEVEFAAHSLFLIYPATQMLTGNLPSYIQNGSNPFLSSTATHAFRLSFVAGDTADVVAWQQNRHSTRQRRQEFANAFNLPLLAARGPSSTDKEGQPDLVAKFSNVYDDWLLSPLFAPDKLLAALPPTAVQICEFDLLRDEGRMMHDRLARVGVPTRLELYRSVHGMYGHLLLGHRPAIVALEHLLAFLRERLGCEEKDSG